MLLSENVVAAAAYKLTAGGFASSSAAKLDRKVAQSAKRLVGASRNTAGAFIFLPKDLHGWGFKSIREELTTTYTRVLLHSLRDPGRLVRVTKGLVREHLRRGYDGCVVSRFSSKWSVCAQQGDIALLPGLTPSSRRLDCIEK